MVTVIQPNGTVSTHPTIDWIKWIKSDSVMCHLYEGEPGNGGSLRGAVPVGSVVTFGEPATIEHRGALNGITLDAAAEIVANTPLDQFTRDAGHHLAAIKRKLKNIDARRWPYNR